MDFSQDILDYKESLTTSSPIWIWYEKSEKDAICKLCNKKVSRPDSTTTCMVNHLKRFHGFLSKNNAWKDYEELSVLKETRLKCKRKMSEADEPPSKQQKITTCLPQKYGPQDPRQLSRNNAVASMICHDAVPTNIANRRGFRHMIKTMDPRYTLPSAKTFSRSIIPKLKGTVDSFLKEKVAEMKKDEISMAFTTDGLDCRDSEKSSVYSFTIYFFEKTELRSEVVMVKTLETPVTGLVIKEFIKQCLRDIGVIDEDGKQLLTIWGVTDRGSNILRALELLKRDGTIEGFHNCFNHDVQLVIKDAITATTGMQNSLDNFQKNARVLAKSRKERNALREVCKVHSLPLIIPHIPNQRRWFGTLFMIEGQFH